MNYEHWHLTNLITTKYKNILHHDLNTLRQHIFTATAAQQIFTEQQQRFRKTTECMMEGIQSNWTAKIVVMD